MEDLNINAAALDLKADLNNTSNSVGGIQEDHARHVEDSATLLKPQTSYSAGDGTSVERVLGTSELLERMLLHMDFFDLVQAQRISCRFKAVIDESLALQRALFFAPGPPSYGYSEANPLLWEPDNRSIAIVTASSRSSADLSPFRLSGYLRMRLTILTWEREYFYHVQLTSPVLKPGSKYERIETDDGRRCFTEGSWRRMLVKQPPCEIYWDSNFTDRECVAPAGTTIGELFKPKHHKGANKATLGDLANGSVAGMNCDAQMRDMEPIECNATVRETKQQDWSHCRRD